MATTRLSDIYVPELFDSLLIQRTKELVNFWGSGIVNQSPQISALAQGGGSTLDMPRLNDLDGEPNIGSDDPEAESTPKKVTSLTDKAIKHFLNNSWSEADLVAALTDPRDPLQQLTNRIGAYWARQYQKHLIASMVGVMADNEANGEGDMVHDISSDAAEDVTPAEKVSFDAVVDTQITMGDALEDIEAIGVHSAVYNQMRKNGNIEYIAEQNSDMRIPVFGDNGLRVIVDDGLPVESGTNRLTYTSILFGANAVGYGEAQPKTPSEIDREPAKGNGEGLEIIYSRRHLVLHPMGISFTSSSVAANAPTRAELQNAANWNRVYERKAVPVAFLKTNG